MLITSDFFAQNKALFEGSNRTTTFVILEELFRRNYEVNMPYWPNRIISFTDDKGRTRMTNGVMNWRTPAMTRFFSGNKHITSLIAAEQKLPLLDTELYESTQQAARFWDQHKGEVILKSVSGAGGTGVWTEFASKEEYLEKAQREVINQRLLLQQKSYALMDLRILYVGDKMVAAAIRRPGYITGDGAATVAELLKRENESRRKINETHHSTMVLALLPPDKVERLFGVKPDMIPADGQRIQVSLANIAGGGLAEDVTDTLHADFLEAGQRMVQALQTPVLAVDFLCDDATKSFADNKESVLFLETNSSPGIDLHHYPHAGEGRNVASAYIDYILDFNEN